MLFILTIHSYSFLPLLYNLSQGLAELNVSLFLSQKTWFSLRTFNEDNHMLVNVQAIKWNFIQQVCLQNFLIKQDNF